MVHTIGGLEKSLQIKLCSNVYTLWAKYSGIFTHAITERKLETTGITFKCGCSVCAHMCI